MAKTKEDQAIVITRPKIAKIRITLVGTIPLMPCQVTKWEIEKLPDPTGEREDSKAKAHTKVPAEELYKARRYMINQNTHGFPAGAVKSAMVSSIRGLRESGKKQLSMAGARPMFTVYAVGHHTLMKLKFSRVEMDFRWGRLPGRNVPWPIYRPMYHDWSCECDIQFDEDLIALQTVINLASQAGRIGLGSLRPEKGGMLGVFEVKTKATVKQRRRSA